MYIKELSELTSVTKRAINHYIDCGLLFPLVEDNGYRVFGEEDTQRLIQINYLRTLGLSINEIKKYFEGSGSFNLEDLLSIRKNEMNDQLLKLKRLEEFTLNQQVPLLSLYEQEMQLIELLELSFPDAFGKFLSVYFKFYMQGEVVSIEDKQAVEKLIAVIDDTTSPELERLLKEFDRICSEKSEDFKNLADMTEIELAHAYDHAMNGEIKVPTFDQYEQIADSNPHVTEVVKITTDLNRELVKMGFMAELDQLLLQLSLKYRMYNEKISHFYEMHREELELYSKRVQEHINK